MSLAIFHPHFVIRSFPSAFYHPHFSIRILLSAIRHPPSAIRHPPSAIRHPPSAIRHPPSAIRHPPSAIRHPPSAIRHPPSAAIRSALYRDPGEEGGRSLLSFPVNFDLQRFRILCFSIKFEQSDGRKNEDIEPLG